MQRHSPRLLLQTIQTWPRDFRCIDLQAIAGSRDFLTLDSDGFLLRWSLD